MDRAAWIQRIRCLAPAAVHRIYALLPKMRLVGVGWGENLRAVADVAMADAQNGRLPKARIPKFIPVGCEPMFVSYPITRTASDIAKDLCKVLGQPSFVPPNLAPAPAFIPKSLSHGKDVLRAFVSNIPDYQMVFGAPSDKARTGLVAKLDTIITSAAGVAREFKESPWFRARITAEEVSVDEWARSIAGDMAGVVFARSDLSGARGTAARQVAADINSRNFGLVQEDFTRCACNSAASAGSLPGVIVIAHGHVKAHVVLAAIREKCVNELVIDSELANSLLQIVR
jgi:DNA-binding transcriptional regulator LsrR (DeoR family)